MFLQFILRRMWRPLNTFPLNPSQENMIACRSSILELTYFSLDRHCCAFLQGKKKKKKRGASGGRGLWWCGEEGRRGWERKQKKKKKRWTEGRGAEKRTTGKIDEVGRGGGELWWPRGGRQPEEEQSADQLSAVMSRPACSMTSSALWRGGSPTKGKQTARPRLYSGRHCEGPLDFVSTEL